MKSAAFLRRTRTSGFLRSALGFQHPTASTAQIGVFRSVNTNVAAPRRPFTSTRVTLKASSISNPKIAGVNEYNVSPSVTDEEQKAIVSVVPKEMREADGTPDYLRLTLTSRIYDVMKETPLTKGVVISEGVGCPVYLKREDLTPVFSFKLRGAYNKMASLTPEETKNGVIACSAGNHAQGVAYAARHMGIKATIIMPRNTPEVKWKNVQRLGAEAVLVGDNFDEAKAECTRLAKEHNLPIIHPYDDPYVIAGQGTIAKEVLQQVDLKKLDAIYIAVGGAGLLAGVSAYVKRLAPHVKVIGVETFDADAFKRSVENGKRVTLKEAGLFADGTAVKVNGVESFRVASENVDDVVLVNKDEICAAIKDVFMDTRSIIEPSGALSVAGMKRYLSMHPPSRPDAAQVCVLSGANMDFDRLRFVAERADLGLNKEVFFSVSIPERAGSFEKLHNIISPRAITEFSYRYSDPDVANIYMSFNVKNRSVELPEVIRQISENGMAAEDISENELAKMHARYLIGGKAFVPNERIYRFEFPERPGALCKFLSTLKSQFSMSLFHYRNQGGDIASVLVGVQVTDDKRALIEDIFNSLGYVWVEETQNPVYQRYLRK
ncbi:threonine ammonia-lyase [Schizosaccharomyces japonicus yFS275]|uniref:Threonine dehydratase n=1 Tax=Schizosaccharomyces japonicus (strain yFS275 / FY16936) TaxID=402676 RepID=B6JWQ1_SCHJY|nr:threonine ammonia-lyase [Schizosaccharomyces japonicus yFS275]EEB05802.1 threonine ammonia-lyase [Schizosaccharomyces japonicus yFS275]